MFTIDFDKVRPLFGGKLTQGQVDGINIILEAFNVYGDGNARHLAYLLATAKWETAHTMQPIYERGTKKYFDKYEPGTKIGNALGNTLKGDGFKFRGRGFVQLTGRTNYTKFGIADNPDAALDPELAAKILVEGCLQGVFTGKKLGDYTRYYDMRRVVNGVDKASEIALIAEGFEAALGVVAPPVLSDEPVFPKRPWWQALIDAILNFLKGK